MDKKTQSEESIENDIINDILLYGKDILNSEAFRKAASEKHHVHGTVYDHTINVCVVSLQLARQLTNRGVEVRKKDLVQAALCHDLGMISRDSKYEDQLDTWRRHPQESARTARMLVPDLSPEAEEMILSHMWPVGGPLPASKEAILLSMADKYASMADWQSWLTNKKFAKQIKDRLEEERL